MPRTKTGTMRCHRNSHFVLCLIGLLWVISGFNVTLADDTLSPLTDGLMVRKMDDVRSRAADWRVLVVLDAPGDVSLGPALEAIYGVIAEKVGSLHSEIIRNWYDRLDLTKRNAKMGLIKPSRRRRRGLLDSGGQVAPRSVRSRDRSGH